MLLSITEPELDGFSLFGDVERSEEVVPYREDKAVVLVPVTLRLAVVDLMLGRAYKDRAEEGSVGEPHVRVAEVVAGNKEEIRGDPETVHGVQRD